MDKHVWNDANAQLKKSSPTNIIGMQEHVFSSVELSYNYLKSEEAKLIFLLCSCFPEDFEIPVEVLASYGMGWMCLQNVDSMEKARSRTHSVVRLLISSFLLIDGDEEGCVKMHDVVRYVARQITSKNKFMIKAGVGLKDWPSRESYKDLKGISLMYNGIDEIPDGLERECPNLEVLLLQKNSALNIPDNFFQGMKDVKVLDLSYNKLSSLPPSLSFLANLITLSLRDCGKLGDDLSLIGNINQLEILDLSFSNIQEIPNSFRQLIYLRVLDLTNCENLTIIPRGVISSLRRLEELYMPANFSHWDSESERDSRSNVGLIELQSLSRLTNLNIFIPSGGILLPEMAFENLKSFSISIGFKINFMTGHFFYKLKKRCSRVLMLSLDTRTSELCGWIKNLLIRTELLHLSEINGIENILPDLVNEGFNELAGLSIKDCKEMKYLFNTCTLETTPRVAFEKLQYLVIDGNPSYLEICHGQLLSRDFNNVKSIVVRDCDNMKILPSPLLQHMRNLEYFRVECCEALVYAFEVDGFKIAEEETELCSSLKELRLWELPRMTHIWKGDVQFVSLHNLQVVTLHICSELREVFPPNLVQSLVHLEQLSISGCGNLEEIFGKKAAEEMVPVPWKRRDPSLALGNLVSISIDSCGKLRSLFTTSMVKSLVRLQSLDVTRCPTLKEIITVTDDEGDEGASTTKSTMTFPSLFHLNLTYLESLSCFCSGLYTIEFPALEDLIISECPGMNTFGYGEVQVTPKLMHPLLDDEDYCWRGNLNEAIEHMFNYKEQIRTKSRIPIFGL